MQIERLTTPAQFAAERERWEELERLDPNATIFTSWRWLNAYAPVARTRPFTLAAREGATTIAYLPLAYGGTFLDRELFMGGAPVADCTGMLALPDREEAAIAAFADAIARERWDGFNVSEARDPRIETLVRRLGDRGMLVAATHQTRCRTTDLPSSWETYITERISALTLSSMLWHWSSMKVTPLPAS